MSTRAGWLVAAACGCGGGAAVRPSTTLPPPTPADQPCEPMLEDAAAGNHDRYTFDGDDGQVGFKDGRGAIVIPARFVHAYEFGPGGIAAVVEPTAGGAGAAGAVRMGFIDVRGRWLADAYRFDNGPDYFQEGLARIVDGGGKVGFIARDGTIVLAPRYAGASSFCHGVATVHDGASAWDIDRAGAEVGPRRPYVREPDPCGEHGGDPCE